MEVIKKYGNRKLYHTNAKRYITLNNIGKLIREGRDVRVIDNVTGEDLTVQTLSQILLQGGRRSGPLPLSLLSNLIQSGGETISQLRRSLFNAAGGDQLINTELRLRLQRLLDEGHISEDEWRRMSKLLLNETETHVEHLPDRSDVEHLKSQVEELSRLVEQLLDEPTA